MKIAITWTSEKRSFAPLILTGKLAKCIEDASILGYQGIELAVRTGKDVSVEEVSKLLSKYNMEVSAVTTGLARAEDGLSFSDMDEKVRQQAVERVKEQIEFASKVKAPVILGLLRGQLDMDEATRRNQLEWVVDCFKECGNYARKLNVDIIIEPINRYETNFLNTVEETIEFTKKIDLPNIGIMVDTFHMNIEERDFAKSMDIGARYLKYVHLADSNRLAPGFGHLNFEKFINLLLNVGYEGYLSIECLPKPNPISAAKQAIEHIRKIKLINI